LLPGTASGYADAQVLAARIEAWQLKQAGPVEPVKPKFWSLGKKQAAVVPRLESAAALLREHGEAETADELLELQTQLA
jgi:hypothetical protein